MTELTLQMPDGLQRRCAAEEFDHGCLLVILCNGNHSKGNSKASILMPLFSTVSCQFCTEISLFKA